jgi:hypothetical protein
MVGLWPNPIAVFRLGVDEKKPLTTDCRQLTTDKKIHQRLEPISYVYFEPGG